MENKLGVEESDKFYSVDVREDSKIHFPKKIDLDKEIGKHYDQIKQLNDMINGHIVSLDAIKRIKQYKKDFANYYYKSKTQNPKPKTNPKSQIQTC